MFSRWEVGLRDTSSCVKHSMFSILKDRSSKREGAAHCSKGNSVGLYTKREVTLDFSAWWVSDTEADMLSLVRANLQEQVKVTLHLRQCKIVPRTPSCLLLFGISCAQRIARLHKATLLYNTAP